MNDKKSSTQELIKHIYRARSEPWLSSLVTAVGVATAFAFSPGPNIIHFIGIIQCLAGALSLAFIVVSRSHYLENPYCGQCGDDLVECMIRRESIADHKHEF